MLTKDRIGGLLVAVAAVIGLVLVFNGHSGGDDDDDDDAPATPPTSQVVPAPGGQVAPGQVPGQTQPGAPTQQQQQPQQPQQGGDNDGDDDDDG